MDERQTSSRGDVGRHLDRIWRELKQLTRQVETETRRGGQVARLRYELRGLRQDREALLTRLGAAVYRAQGDADRRPALRNVLGYDDAIEDLRQVDEQIGDREATLQVVLSSPREGADAA
ncbi:MAG: hypothetical protein GKS06_18215 [Acidobacteria bacterium]|nr:hypothetical protein [Acidobacteriota bacterium]